MLRPRPYQIESVKAVEAGWARGVRRPAVVLPTGTGKSVCIASLVGRRHERAAMALGRPGDGSRTLLIAHRSELVEQNAEKIRDVAPGLRVGIVANTRNETRADVVSASFGTLLNESRRRMIADVGLVVIDECHHAPAAGYLEILRHYGVWGDGDAIGQSVNALGVGFTATMVRADSKALGDVWQEVVYSRGIAEMVAAGYLVRPRGIKIRVDDLDLSKVRQTRGDYSKGDLGRAISDSMAPELIAKAIGEHAPGRPGIVFCATVESANVIGEAMAAAGLSMRVIWGAMPKEARKAALKAFKAGQIDWLVNCGVLTEGTDLPRAAVAVIARPTKSHGLLIQMVGRVLRLHPGKAEALVLFVTDSASKHSLSVPIELFGEETAELAEKDIDEDEELEGLDDDLILDLGDVGGVMGDEPEYANGPMVVEEVDLFRSSSNAWLQTYGGVWFLPAGERLIALLPGRESGTWDVIAMHASKMGTGVDVAEGVHQMSYAMAWAEGEVTHAERMAVAREEKWRGTRSTPTQKRVASSLGIKVTPFMTKGEVAGLINVAGASWRIDPIAAVYAQRRGYR